MFFTPIISLPSGAAADLGANASQIVADLSPIWLLVGGVILGAVVVSFIIRSLHR